MATSVAAPLTGAAAAQALAGFDQLYGGLQRDASRWEVVVYYKKPDTYPDPRYPQGRANPQAGWIFWADSQDGRQIEFLREGNKLVALTVPDPRNPRIQRPLAIRESDPDYQAYGNWGPILCHPQGPGLFPLSQLLALGWYDPNRVPVPNVVFPALKGQKLTVWDCPECSDFTAITPQLIARHLSRTHNWTPLDLDRLGKEWGVTFERALTNKGRREFDYSDDAEDDLDTAPAVPPDYEIERRTATTRKGQALGQGDKAA